MKPPQPQPPHTGGTFHRRLQPLYTEKHKVSCSGFLPNTGPMQRSCGHHNAFCSMTWQTRVYLRTWQHQMTTIMQPFQCDLRPQIPETQRTTHTETTTRCRTQRRNQFADKTTAAATAAHRRYLSSPAPSTLHGKTQSFVLPLPPQNRPHVTFIDHSNAICNHRFQKRKERRTQKQPLAAEHRGETNSRMKRPQPQPPHTGGTFYRRLQPLYTEKHKVSCSGFLPKTDPIKHSCSHFNALCSMTRLTRMYLRILQHQMTTIMQPFQCDLQPQIPETQKTTHTETTTRCRTQRRNQFADKTTTAATAAHRDQRVVHIVSRNLT